MTMHIKADDLDRNSRAILEGVLHRMAASPGDLAPLSFIDVGCGEGRLLTHLAELGASRLIGVGWKIKVPPGAVRVEGVDLSRAGWTDRLEGKLFDWVISTEVLEHLVNPFDYLVGLRRLASPQGRLLLTFPNVHNLRSIVGYAVSGRFSGFFGPNFNKNHPLYDQHIFVPNHHLIRYFLRLAGFTDVKINYLNGIGRLFSQTTLLEATPCAPIQLPE